MQENRLSPTFPLLRLSLFPTLRPLHGLTCHPQLTHSYSSYSTQPAFFPYLCSQRPRHFLQDGCDRSGDCRAYCCGAWNNCKLNHSFPRLGRKDEGQGKRKTSTCSLSKQTEINSACRNHPLLRFPPQRERSDLARHGRMGNLPMLVRPKEVRHTHTEKEEVEADRRPDSRSLGLREG